MNLRLWFAVGSLCFATAAEAQVYVLGRTDTLMVVKSVNEEDGARRVQERAQRAGGHWKILLQSDRPGFGAVYSFSDRDNSNPHYFISEGQSTYKAASDQAKAEATSAAGGRNVGLQTTFENKNQFLLRRIEP